MMAGSGTRSNQRPDTLMQDCAPPDRQSPLATHGRTIHLGGITAMEGGAAAVVCCPDWHVGRPTPTSRHGTTEDPGLRPRRRTDGVRRPRPSGSDLPLLRGRQGCPIGPALGLVIRGLARASQSSAAPRPRAAQALMPSSHPFLCPWSARSKIDFGRSRPNALAALARWQKRLQGALPLAVTLS